MTSTNLNMTTSTNISNPNEFKLTNQNQSNSFELNYNGSHEKKHKVDHENIMIDADYDYQKGEVQDGYDMQEPSVSEVVQSLFQKNIENNTFNKSESIKYKHRNLQQNQKKKQIKQNQTTTHQGLFQSLMSISPLNSWSNGYKDDLNNFEKLESEKQKQYQKEFSSIVDSDLDTNKFNTWTQQRELNQVIRELSQEPNEYLTTFGKNIQTKIKAIMNGDHLKNPIPLSKPADSTDSQKKDSPEKAENQAQQAPQEVKSEHFDTNYAQDWKYIQAQLWKTIAIGLTYFQPISYYCAYCAQSTYDLVKMTVQFGQQKLQQVQKNYELSDVGFILLFAVLVAMLFVICCIFFCMGKMMIACVICFLALIIVVIAAMLYLNKVQSKHETHDDSQ